MANTKAGATGNRNGPLPIATLDQKFKELVGKIMALETPDDPNMDLDILDSLKEEFARLGRGDTADALTTLIDSVDEGRT